MGLELESRGREADEVGRTALDVVDLAAGAAVEVVMVAQPGDLVTRGLGGQLDGDRQREAIR